jgi:hypothetical protein
MTAPQPTTAQTRYERPWPPRRPWPMSLDAAREQRAAQGMSLASVRESAAPYVARPHCELIELRVREMTDHSEWRCACGGHEVVTGGYDDAFMAYRDHRRTSDHWRIQAIATTTWARIEDGRVTRLSDERPKIGVVVLVDDGTKIGDAITTE